MAVKSVIEVKTDGAKLAELRGEKIGEVVEDGIAGTDFIDKSIISNESINSTSTQVIVTYTPTLFGKEGAQRTLASLSDFYNKVTGSALQTTDISETDLLVYLILATEWRKFVKTLDKLIDQYNQISSTNAAFGRLHIDAVFGRGAYDMMADNSANVINARNEIAVLINTRLRLPVGCTSYHFESDLIDKTYIDDPNGKGCLIDFRRVYRDGEAKVTPVEGGIGGLAGADPDDYSDAWPFYLAIDLTGASKVFTTYFNFADYNYFEKAKQLLDRLVKETWYKDVQPYITHMLKNIKADELSIDKQLNKTGDWNPYYSPDILAFIRNAHYVGKLLNQASSINGGLSIYEDETTGEIVQGKIRYFDSAQRFATGLHVAPIIGDIFPDTEGWKKRDGYQLFENTDDNFLLNLEDYPASKDMIRQAVYGLFKFKKPETESFDGSRIIGSCGPILFNNIYYAYVDETNTSRPVRFRPLYPTALVYGTNADFVREDVRVLNGNTDQKYLVEFLLAKQYNFTPAMKVLYITPANLKSASYAVQAFIDNASRKSAFICHDVDSLVYYDEKRLAQNLKEIAAHSFYDPDSVALEHVSSKK